MTAKLVSRLEMPRDAYDAIDRAHYSTLKSFERSAAHYQEAEREARESTDALRVGIASHLACLEPERYAAEVAVWEGDRRGNKWKDFEAENAARTILKAEQAARVEALAKAVRENVEALRYLREGEGEVTALWTDAVTGIECKARFDWVAAVGAIVDLKTCRDASPRGFERQAWVLGYHGQAAFYSDALHACTGERFPFTIIAVESEAPHVVQAYDMSRELLDAGRKAYRGWLTQLAECRSSGEWPGYAEGRIELRPPKWADASGESAFDDSDDDTTQDAA